MALNLASTVPDWLARLGGRPMVLGLDLQGGVRFVLQVDQKAALDKRLDAYTEDVRGTLRDARIAYQSVERRADNSIVANLSPSAGDDAAQRARAALVKAQPTLGYDVSGNRITVTVPETEITDRQRRHRAEHQHPAQPREPARRGRADHPAPGCRPWSCSCRACRTPPKPSA